MPAQRFLILTVALLAGATNALAAATPDHYPTRPMRLLVGFAAGGGSDIIARALAQQLTESLGQQVVTDNRTGAGGLISAELAARAPPDGYTLVLGSASVFSITPHLHKKLPYDIWRDFAPVASLASTPYVLLVNPNLPVRSVKELIALARARAGKLNYGSAGNGATTHLVTVYFESLAGIRMQHVPYKGGSPAMTDLMAGQIDVLFDPAITTLPHVAGGRIRALAISTAKRSPLFADLPTIAEAGLPGYESGNWFGILATGGSPQSAVARLNTAINGALDRPAMRERLLVQGADPSPGSVSDFAALIKREFARYGKIVRESGIRLD